MDLVEGGYKGLALEMLKNFGIDVWSEVKLKTQETEFVGIVLPRSQKADDRHIVLKLRNGYNVGIKVDKILSIELLGQKETKQTTNFKERLHDPSKPTVKLNSTGGTIASRLDYRTGAVVPAFEPEELYEFIPEITNFCNLHTEKLYSVLSEDIGPKEWIGIANAVARDIEAGYHGIVIAHGTDTMHFTSSLLSFMIQNPPIPIVMVGSQRSSDRPASDAPLNLIYSVKTASESDIAEVTVCAVGPVSDSYGLLHRGTRVRKMHSSHRSTFRTIGDIPLALVSKEKITPLRKDYNRRRKDRAFNAKISFEEKVALIYHYPNMKPDVIEALIDNGYKGIVIAGSGLGHVNNQMYPALKKAHEKGIFILMTVQTLWGYVQMYVYETGREIMSLGVVPAENMLPETAYMKLCWTLGQTTNPEQVKEIMLTPIVGEITEREPTNAYLIFQGGIPEIEEFISKLRM
ncbi:Glu-tRNA(Gln) amidotransferase GatDE subunit D [Bacteroidetes/Chlorobi group bacterium Naka2016]|jgi:glutamyl-tRNA(Gln) amidotransferase subunit D|nr:MAG: Glu-tRNA(Gln) amidotransferase GatDE subunit D [Bacteroidetes/Chlorobi group bacterium Naka2016]